MRLRTASALIAVVTLLIPVTAGAMPADDLPVGPRGEVVNEIREVFAEDGTIARVPVEVPVGTPFTAAELAEVAPSVSALHEGGPSENRYDIVIMGDGYTADELDLFRTHAAAHWSTIRDTQPFTDYEDFFNVWVVDVVSDESGVDNDAHPGEQKDTALDMYFYCSGVERGLCVDQAKADQVAALAPEADQLLVLANSTKYGGIGGRVATASGGNALSELISVHELGHSLGGLADEYDYYLRAGLEDDAAQDVTIPAPFLYYPGAVLGEPSGVNTTAESDPARMVERELKWWRWIGEESPDGGVVGAFEGSGYYRFGQYRPTQDSLMHTLGTPEDPNPFNLPSREQMIARFYGVVRPVETVSPEPDAGPLAVGDVISLELVGPRTHALEVMWSVDDQPLPDLAGATSVVVDEAMAGASTLAVQVVDPTDQVRDPDHRAQRLTQTVSWELGRG